MKLGEDGVVSTRRWLLAGSIAFAMVIIVILIGINSSQASPAALRPTQTASTDLSSQPAVDVQPATPSATPLITVTPTPSVTSTFLPPEPTQLTVELSSTPSEIPPATAALATVVGSSQSEAFDLPAGLYRVTLRTDGGFSVMQPIVEDGACAEFPLF